MIRFRLRGLCVKHISFVSQRGGCFGNLGTKFWYFSDRFDLTCSGSTLVAHYHDATPIDDTPLDATRCERVNRPIYSYSGQL